MAAANRADSIPSASPHREHRTSASVPEAGPRRPTQASHTRTLPSEAMAAPQSRQSDGRKILAKSATTQSIASRQLRSVRINPRRPASKPHGKPVPPGGPPLPSWTSFMLTLKTNLTRGGAKKSASSTDEEKYNPPSYPQQYPPASPPLRPRALSEPARRFTMRLASRSLCLPGSWPEDDSMLYTLASTLYTSPLCSH
jgi:hypothetical protein